MILEDKLSIKSLAKMNDAELDFLIQKNESLCKCKMRDLEDLQEDLKMLSINKALLGKEYESFKRKLDYQMGWTSVEMKAYEIRKKCISTFKEFNGLMKKKDFCGNNYEKEAIEYLQKIDEYFNEAEKLNIIVEKLESGKYTPQLNDGEVN